MKPLPLAREQLDPSIYQRQRRSVSFIRAEKALPNDYGSFVFLTFDSIVDGFVRIVH